MIKIRCITEKDLCIKQRLTYSQPIKQMKNCPQLIPANQFPFSEAHEGKPWEATRCSWGSLPQSLLLHCN